MNLAQVTPVVVRVVDEPTPETSVADILIGAVGLVGFVLLLAAVVGIVAGCLFILMRKLQARHEVPGAPSELALGLNSLDDRRALH